MADYLQQNWPARRSVTRAAVPFLWLFVSIAASVGCASADKVGQATLVIQGATVFDAHNGVWLEDATLVIADERILLITDADAVPASLPAQAQIIDASGKWVVPGLIDVHVHHADEDYLRTMLAWGITSVHVMPHAPPESPIEMERASEAARAASPRLQVSQMFTGDFPDNVLPGVYAFMKPQSATEARDAVVQLSASGYRQIKIIQDDSVLSSGPEYRSPRLEPAVFDALVTQAHTLGMRVYVHATSLADARQALGTSVEAFLHGVVDAPLNAADWQRLLEVNAAWVPTFHQIYLFGDQRAYARRVLADTRLVAWLSDEELAGFQQQVGAANPIIDVTTQTLVDHSSDYMATSALNTRAAQDAGVPIAVGSDGGPAGVSTHLEIRLLQDNGLTATQALTAATLGGALAIGRDADVGSLEAGKFADLVILNADPSADVRNCREIAWVVKGGLAYSPRELGAPRDSGGS